MAKKKFYVVWRGYRTGIFHSWDECKKSIAGYPNAQYKSFPTLFAAEQALTNNYEDYITRSTNMTMPLLGIEENAPKPVLPSLSVDAACNGAPGDMEYRGVDTQTKKVIFSQGPYPEGTNNVGEFLAIVHALAHQKKHGMQLPIYTDSVTAMSWVRKKHAATTLKKSSRNGMIFNLIERAEKWLKENKVTTPILKWETHVWGEIPADYGRK